MDLDPLIPLLDKVEDRQAALVAAKWLVKHLSGDESKAKAMDKALAIARQCKELTKTEVRALTESDGGERMNKGEVAKGVTG